jgi:cytochrome c oxidase subunit 2
MFFDWMKWFPENVSTFGTGVDALFYTIYMISLGIFFLVFGLGIWFIIKYRFSPTRKAYHYHGNNLIEFTWTLLPTLLFAGLGVYSDGMWEEAKYKNVFPKADLEVEVLGQAFLWNYRYAGADGQFGKTNRDLMSASNPFGIDPNDPFGKDDITTVNAMHAPVNKNIRIRLSSVDVLHSYFLPNMRVKQDAVPGSWVDVWWNATKTGKYELVCAELCGSGHYAMRGELFVDSQAEFDKWMDQQMMAKVPTASAAPAPTATDTTASN